MIYLFNRKYGLSSDYILNFKNNILFKSRNNSDTDTTTISHTIHSSILNFKKPKSTSTQLSQSNQAQYQIGSDNTRFISNNLLAVPSQHNNTEIMSKNPTFNYGIFKIFLF